MQAVHDGNVGGQAPLPLSVFSCTNGEVSHCPNCQANMIKVRKCSTWTIVVGCLTGCQGLNSYYSWKKEMKCLGCAHTVVI
ncbi:UNKNOWN [Stylonychia lemnae]|uniref:LITAF domain-containing protein n=1 Tax=Stylonychia lemnae TaxID=5949 RepID=A0A078B5Z1_STYLE|nr:UNKNOWN [Stylonychia lemnae]|eukprot:CDW88913.1 UNKNOWN [Stylonychia lemnae]